MQARQNRDLSHCFRQVTRMAEANVGPPESAPDESGSGEDQKEEKQDEEEEGDRAFEVELFMSSHATYRWMSCYGMNLLSLSLSISANHYHHISKVIIIWPLFSATYAWTPPEMQWCQCVDTSSVGPVYTRWPNLSSMSMPAHDTMT